MFASKDLFLTRPSGYQISRSVRLRSSATAYFNRTPASASNRTTWTWSGWAKRGDIGSSVTRTMFTAVVDVNNRSRLYFETDGTLNYLDVIGGSVTSRRTSSAVYRDPSAWYHIVCAYDTTQATAANRIKLYVNGSQLTSFSSSTDPSLNYASGLVNSTNAHEIGRLISEYFDGYLTEVNFIDGQALTPSSFGENDAVTGVWKPKKYTGTYGTNGFYLNFSDNSSNTATTIGKDYSGNGNNWTPNNISVTAGATYDSMLDVPTLYADGGNGRGNYAVLNPLATLSGGSGSATWTNGNLTFGPVQAEGSAVKTAIASIICPSSGKWYWEITPSTLPSTASRGGVGIMNVASLNDAFQAAAGPAGAYSYHANGYKSASPSDTGYGVYGASYIAGDVIGVALDMDAGTLTFYKNGSSQGTAYSGLSGEYYPAVGFWITVNANFGQRPFTYTPPTGFVALNTQNLPTPTITNGATVMAASTYTGTGATQTIANSGNNAGAISFKPDLVWIKSRNNTWWNILTDSVRGNAYNLYSNSTSAEGNSSPQGITSFNSNGFSMGTYDNINTSTNTYVAWQWQAGQGTTSSNTSGSITSTVSVNATAGFSVATFSNATSGTSFTFGHGLGVAPSLVIFKYRNTTSNWYVYHKSTGNTGLTFLDTTGAFSANSTYLNNTSPTSTVVTLGSSFITGTAYNFVAYCWSEVSGYSKAFSFTGNGSTDGSFVYLGFLPRMILLKRTDTTGNWYIWDTSRNTYNVLGEELYPNLSNAASSATDLDILSNGFKLRNSTAGFNANGGTYIGFAWAANPFKNSLGF